MSAFEPESFLDAAITTPLTKRPPADAGRPYSAVIGEPKIRAWQSKTDSSKSGYALDLPLEITLPQDVATRLGTPKIVVTDSVFLDTLPGGGLDMAPGKNRRLRNYYDATDLNKPGTFPRMLQARPVTIVLSHDAASDGSGDMYERVATIGKG